MAMNKFMHPRNPYKKRPNFKQLAIEFPEFRKFAKQDLSGKIQFNFKDQGAVWALTKCLLKRDFDLNVEILPDRLVPTLPLRMNYLLWIEDMLNIYKPKNVYGIDIGTGACCIYPLLGAKHFSWNMLATEIDISSIKCAMSNVENNFLSDKIQVKAVTEDVILNGALDEETIYDFCVCNPPFFSDSEELIMEKHSRNKSRPEPKNAPSGIPTELLTPGGELVFIARLITDSQILGDKVRIYSAMIGKKANLKHLKELVRECEGLSSMATSVFCQGQTTRWGLAWTFVPGLDLIQAPHVSSKRKVHSMHSFPSYRFPVTEQQTLQSVKEKLLNIFSDLKIETDYEETDDAVMITLKAFENTWVNSRKKRRQQKLLQQQQEESSGGIEGSGCTVDEKMQKKNGDDEKPENNQPSSSQESKETRQDQSEGAQPSMDITDQKDEHMDSEKAALDELNGSQDSKRPRPDEEDVPQCSKRPKLEEKKVEDCKPEQPEYLVASLILKEEEEGTVLAIEMYFIEGTGGKDSANQLLTCLKNRLKT